MGWSVTSRKGCIHGCQVSANSQPATLGSPYLDLCIGLSVLVTLLLCHPKKSTVEATVYFDLAVEGILCHASEILTVTQVSPVQCGRALNTKIYENQKVSVTLKAGFSTHRISDKAYMTLCECEVGKTSKAQPVLRELGLT